MKNSRSYWREVARILEKEHQLDAKVVEDMIQNYRNILKEDGVGDIIYHSPLDETVQGIINNFPKG